MVDSKVIKYLSAHYDGQFSAEYAVLSCMVAGKTPDTVSLQKVADRHPKIRKQVTKMLHKAITNKSK